MTESAAAPIGMVDSLADLSGGPTEEALAFARAYVADGEMDPALLALLRDPERLAERAVADAAKKARDWPALSHYRAANAALAGQRTDVVFIGDSITEMWRIAQPDLFRDGVVNRGISGQTSPQILLRFMPDVIALKPRAVHLMCGINDVAGNTGPTTPADYKANILAMLELARANGVTVILAGLTPISGLPWTPGVQDPKGRAAELNAWLAALAAERGLIHADYGPVLADAQGGLRADYTRDGVHPVGRGYDAMRPVAVAAMNAALQKPAGD
ncbi:GDSL-type esterase/lipase family protein [Brevundimonas lenta]|uniref:Lysophospholipase L1-like esterase n=1 Tax=Brevundimonas lenta TaxID=424796 RepID=A0A7W6NN44_9CAUL|nr:GDSL-type esterase/lipase family protein [Brevundimonas lenta]MBB4081990.1 lysophospholipase L1-like esterase [Brevundimonas lenta]